jgi:protein TonB
MEHIKKHQRYPKEALKQKLQGKVFVFFVVDKEGYVVIKDVRGPSALLEDEAKRVIQLLPKMKPGEANGEVIQTPFAIPFTFKN